MPGQEEFENKTYIFWQKSHEYVGFLSFVGTENNTKAMRGNKQDNHNNRANAKTLAFQGVEAFPKNREFVQPKAQI